MGALPGRSCIRIVDGSARRSLLDDQWIRWEVSIPWIRWEVSAPWIRWEVSAPSLLLGNGQVAPHERWRAQRARSEALAKRVFLNTQLGRHDLATSRYRTSRPVVGHDLFTAK